MAVMLSVGHCCFCGICLMVSVLSFYLCVHQPFFSSDGNGESTFLY